MKFDTIGEENLEQLVDLSLGIVSSVNVNNVVGRNLRFGILSNEPFTKSDTARLEIPNLKPMKTGRIKFRTSKFSPSYSFTCNLYMSHLSKFLPDNLTKLRIEGAFFDFIITPFTGSANYSFSFDGIQMKLTEMRSALKLMSMLYTNSTEFIVDLEFDDYPDLSFKMGSKADDASWTWHNEIIDNACFLSDFFELDNHNTCSLLDLEKCGRQMHDLTNVLKSAPETFKVEFSIKDRSIGNPDKVVCQLFLSTNIGDYVAGCIVSLVGNVESIGDERYRLITSRMDITRKIIVERDVIIQKEDLITELNLAAEPYQKDGYFVVNVGD